MLCSIRLTFKTQNLMPSEDENLTLDKKKFSLTLFLRNYVFCDVKNLENKFEAFQA